VALNALINPANAGGSEASALSILTSFRDAAPTDVDMVVTALPAYAEAMTALRGDPAKVIVWPWPEFTPVSSEPRQGWRKFIRHRIKGPEARRRFDDRTRAANERAFLKRMPKAADVDGLLDRFGVDVVHFTYPVTWPTRRPFIFEPHDIQQHHFPEFFSPDVLAWRAKTYAEGIARAAFVVCGTWWTKQDIMRVYGAPASRVAVVPRSSVRARSQVGEGVAAALAAKARLPERFMLYPAMTFPHKNHERLLRAIARLRDEQGLVVNLVCTGREYPPHQPELERWVKRLKLKDQVRFLGVVSDDLLAVCYRRAAFVVFPSLLEGHSQALLEALWHNTPIVAANQSSIPETVGKAAAFFNGLDVGDIVRAVGQAWTDPGLLAELARRAEGSFARYDWDRARLTLTACYKSAAGRPLSPGEEAALDRALLPEKPQDA
jgi:glycosyltransferase involved in cell wall biosynthesis